MYLTLPRPIHTHSINHKDKRFIFASFATFSVQMLQCATLSVPSFIVSATRETAKAQARIYISIHGVDNTGIVGCFHPTLMAFSPQFVFQIPLRQRMAPRTVFVFIIISLMCLHRVSYYPFFR